MTLLTAIKIESNKLKEKARLKGIYENFGQKEVRDLEDKYADGTTGKIEAIQAFEIWCMDYCG